MSGNGSTSSIEETAPGQDEVRSDGGLLHRLGRFLRGISLRCRRGIDRHRQQRRTTEDKNPRNSVQKDSSDGNQSSTARQGKQDSDEDGTVITEEKTTNVSKCQPPESTIPESTLPVPHEHDVLQYHHGDTDGERPDHVLPGPVFQEKDNTCNTTRPSTLPILDGSQTSTYLHQLLQKENISKKSPKDLSSHIHNTVHVVQSTSTTLVKSPTRHYPSLRTEVTKDLSKNESLFTTNGHITDSQQPSFRWLVDSRKTATVPLGDSDHAFGIDLVQSKSVDQQENIPIRGPSVPQTLTDHTKLLDSVARVSIWNRLPSRHKRTLNFSRNYVQYGNNDIQDIELETHPTVDEWCSKQQNDTPDHSNEEKFQPLLKLAITDKPVEIPQSRNTKSHDIIECFRSPQLDKPEGDKCDLTTVEQGLHVGVVAHHQDIVREYKTEENDYIANELCVVNRQNQQMLTNIAQPNSKNERHPYATNDEIDSPGQQPKTLISQTSVEELNVQELDTRDRQQPKTLNSQNSVEALKGQELDTTDRQKSKPTNGQQQIDSNDHVTSTKGQMPKATGVKQPKDIPKQEKISSQKLETSNRYKSTGGCGDLQETPQMSQEATLGEEARATQQNLEETPGQEPKVMDCEHQGQINSRHSESTNKVQDPAITARRKQPSRLADGQQPTRRTRLTLEATDSQSSVATNGQQSGLNSSQEINQEKHTIVAEQCEDITFDEEVLPIQTVRHRQDQACNDTEMCDDNMNQMIKKELSRSKDKTTTHGEWSRAQTDSQPLPIEITMVTSDINREMEHEPLKPSPEHRLTRTEKNDNISTTNGATKLKTSSALFPSPQGGVYELSVKQLDCAMFENQGNKYRELNANDAGCLNISSTTKQTSNVKHGFMCLDNSFGVATTNRINHSNVSTAKRVIVNKAFFISRQNSEPKYTNRESTKEANVNQIDPTKQLSADGKKDSLIHTSGQRNVEPVVEYSKFNTDTTGKLSDREVNEAVLLNVSIDQTRSVESSSEETSFRNGLIQDTSFP
ncbi:uncharacterized protein LOC117316768 [Pecten maximus]|uniref:uncharacterized protein LOC117316768 n=1 Tax=Pecten maximus TaxID=6579 RepID=UPI001458EFAF|nr:uncharacterized protein LOC117316768 [Pecten maximus]